MTNLFLCHRPYHVFRSAQIADLIQQKCENVRSHIVTFNVYNYSGGKGGSATQKFNSFDHLFRYESFFCKHIGFDRGGEKRIWNLYEYVHYHNGEVERIRKILSELGPVDNVFFFSDKEKPLEMFVSLSREMNGSVNFLVDEGIVSYNTSKNAILDSVKKTVIGLFRLKHISKSFGYGQSGLFEYSLASIPEKSVIAAKRTFKMPVIDNARVNRVIRKELVLLDRKNMIYVSNASVEAHDCQLADEINCLEDLQSKLTGYQLVIKMHPVEKPGKFGEVRGAIIIDDPFLPVESLYSRNNIVLSTYSSALINAKLFGIPSVSLAGLMEIKNKDGDSIMKTVGIFCPQNWNELAEYVRNFAVNADLACDTQNDEFITVLKNTGSTIDV